MNLMELAGKSKKKERHKKNIQLITLKLKVKRKNILFIIDKF
tara:strand:- start:976 stop:1101 length:126 start_codon:yes stop_codon:yes gene_type:complete